MDEPMTGEHDKMVKYVAGTATTSFEIYDLAGGDDNKVVEITYTRAK